MSEENRLRMRKIQEVIINEDYPLFKKLLDEELNHKDIYHIKIGEDTLLEYALRNGSYSMFEHISDFMDINKIHKPIHEPTILAEYIQDMPDQVLTAVELLLKYIDNVDERSGGQTSLGITLQNYRSYGTGETIESENYGDLCKKIVALLLDHGADPFIELTRIISDNEFELLDIFLEHSKYDFTERALHTSITVNNYDFVEHLLKYCDDINFRFLNIKSESCNLLWLAKVMEPRNEDIIELLITNGCRTPVPEVRARY